MRNPSLIATAAWHRDTEKGATRMNADGVSRGEYRTLCMLLDFSLSGQGSNRNTSASSCSADMFGCNHKTCGCCELRRQHQFKAVPDMADGVWVSPEIAFRKHNPFFSTNTISPPPFTHTRTHARIHTHLGNIFIIPETKHKCTMQGMW